MAVNTVQCVVLFDGLAVPVDVEVTGEGGEAHVEVAPLDEPLVRLGGLVGRLGRPLWFHHLTQGVKTCSRE